MESIRVEVREAEGEEAKLEGEMEGLKREQAALHKDMTRAEREAKKRRDKVQHHHHHHTHTQIGGRCIDRERGREGSMC